MSSCDIPPLNNKKISLLLTSPIFLKFLNGNSLQYAELYTLITLLTNSRIDFELQYVAGSTSVAAAYNLTIYLTPTCTFGLIINLQTGGSTFSNI